MTDNLPLDVADGRRSGPSSLASIIALVFIRIAWTQTRWQHCDYDLLRKV
jgi:hypothetical protein